MKDLVKSAKSFMTFDYPLQTAHISAQFAGTHLKLQLENPGWSTNATRQKLISSYWFTYVAGHYSALFGLAILSVPFLSGNFTASNFYLFSILFAAFVSYPILYLFHYRPYFSSIFLPGLETAKETYEHKQTEHLEKCRQVQLSNLALVLIFYVFDKTSGINSLQCNDQYSAQMTKLYGVDRGSLKSNLELIIGITGKRKNLTDRKRTEITNRFGEAYLFLEEIKFDAGAEELKKLETKLFNNL